MLGFLIDFFSFVRAL